MTSKEAKSCIKTIEMLRRLAYNIHGVMDVIDADNCEKIIKALEQDNCPYYVIDEDGHGICKNHRYMEDVLGKIRAEIKALSNVNPSYWHSGDMVEREEVFGIIDKYKAESDHKCHTCKHYTSGEKDGSCDSYICEHYSNWESEG